MIKLIRVTRSFQPERTLHLKTWIPIDKILRVNEAADPEYLNEICGHTNCNTIIEMTDEVIYVCEKAGEIVNKIELDI